MRESKIESRLRDGVKSRGGWAVKFVSPGTRGAPDRQVFMPGGKVYFVETKSPGKTAEVLQKLFHRKLRAFGHDVRLVDTMQKVDEFLKFLDDDI